MVGFVKAFVCAWEHKRAEMICHEGREKAKNRGDMVMRRSGRGMSGGGSDSGSGSGSSITFEWMDVVNKRVE